MTRRNEPCTCGSGKKYKKCCMSTELNPLKMSFPVAGQKLSANQIQEMTADFQQNIKESPMWEEMVREFGIEEAERLLKECRANVE